MSTKLGLKDKPPRLKEEEQKEINTPGTGFTSKMRIKLYDPKTQLLVSDRLVEQNLELTSGPKFVHKGPISVELNLLNAGHVNLAVDYLKKLQGELPLEAKITKTKTSKKLDEMLSDKEPIQDLLKACKAKCKTQEELISYLREYNFRFLDSSFIQDNATKEMITLKSKHVGEWQFMARLSKEAKDPANDKYDYRLVFGIKIVGNRVNQVLIYLWGEFQERWSLDWKKLKEMNFKKVEKVYIFPEWMDYAERKRWRLENRKIMTATENGKNPGALEPSKFYKKCAPYIKVH